jgi:Zn-dependent protease with chaperone function
VYTRIVKNSIPAINILLLCVLVAAVSAGCTAARQVRIIGPSEEPEAYSRIAPIFWELVPEMDAIAKRNYVFFVSDDEELNAFALSNYVIVVNRGLLNVLNNRELTCVIAHEIAHISLGHYDRRAAVEKSKHLVFSELDRVAPEAGLLSSVIKPLAIKAFSREQETEADIEAVRAIRRLRISPEEYEAVLRKLLEHNERTGRGNGGGLLDDHPAIESRIEKIEQMHFSTDW